MSDHRVAVVNKGIGLGIARQLAEVQQDRDIA